MLALLQLALPSLLSAASERWIRSSLAGTLAATVPLLVVPLAPLFGVHESLDVRRAVDLLVGFAGVVVLLGLGAPKDLYEWIGIGCVLLAALAYAIAPLIIERHLKDRQDLGSAAASLGVAAIILAPAVIWSMPTSMPSPAVSGSLVVLGMVSTGFGLALYFFLIREVGAARIGRHLLQARDRRCSWCAGVARVVPAEFQGWIAHDHPRLVDGDTRVRKCTLSSGGRSGFNASPLQEAM